MDSEAESDDAELLLSLPLSLPSLLLAQRSFLRPDDELPLPLLAFFFVFVFFLSFFLVSFFAAFLSAATLRLRSTSDAWDSIVAVVAAAAELVGPQMPGASSGAPYLPLTTATMGKMARTASFVRLAACWSCRRRRQKTRED